jgi:hypothetical protein
MHVAVLCRFIGMLSYTARIRIPLSDKIRFFYGLRTAAAHGRTAAAGRFAMISGFGPMAAIVNGF